jgi:hypothetical protein
VETLAGRLRSFLTRLGAVHPALADWHATVDNPDENSPPLALDEDTLASLLMRGRSRGDFDGQIVEELGYRTSLWNGREDDWEAGIMVTCGVTTDAVPNAIVLDPPFPSPHNTELFRPSVARGMVEAVAEAWAPERAKFITNDLDEKQERLPLPQVGWLTYVTGELPTDPPPGGAVVNPFGEGFLVRIGSEPLSVGVAEVQEIRDWLGIGVPRLSA